MVGLADWVKQLYDEKGKQQYFALKLWEANQRREKEVHVANRIANRQTPKAAEMAQRHLEAAQQKYERAVQYYTLCSQRHLQMASSVYERLQKELQGLGKTIEDFPEVVQLMATAG